MKIKQSEIETLKYLMYDQLGDSADEFERRQKALQWAINQLEWRSMETAPDDETLVDILCSDPCGTRIIRDISSGYSKRTLKWALGWRPRPVAPEVSE